MLGNKRTVQTFESLRVEMQRPVDLQHDSLCIAGNDQRKGQLRTMGIFKASRETVLGRGADGEREGNVGGANAGERKRLDCGVCQDVAEKE